MGHFGYMLSQSTGIWYFMRVLTTTKSISWVFRLTSGEGQIALVTISVILISFSITEDTHFHVSDLTDACKNCTLLTTPYRSTTLSYYFIIGLHISKMDVMQGH